MAPAIDVSGLPLVPYYRNSKPGKRRKVISVETQDFFIRDHAEEHNLPLYDGPPIVDKDKGAAPDAKERPGWKRVMELVATCRYGGIIVRDADRAARDGWISEQLIRLVREKNLKGFRVVSPVVTYDLSTQEGVSDFRRRIDEAEKEVYLIRRRTAMTLKHKALMGETTSGQKRVFGWLDKPNNVHEPTEAEAIDTASRMLLFEDAEVIDILDVWEKHGILTIHGLPFDNGKLRSVLCRPSNAGIITAGDREVGRMPGKPIVEEDVYRAVVAHFATITRGRKPFRTFLLSRLDVLKCDDCDSRMGGEGPDKGYAAYRCSHKKSARRRQGCGQRVDMDHVDALVKAKTIAWWSDPARAVHDHEVLVPVDPEAQKLHEQLNAIEDRIQLLLTKLDLSPNRFDVSMEALARMRDNLIVRLGALPEAPVLEKVTRERAVKMWGEGPKVRREMIKAAIREIRVKPAELTQGRRRVFNPDRLVWKFW
jgi:DNA invertase Pin-like site-specific DNA recombinase